METYFASYQRDFTSPLQTGASTFSKRQGFLLKRGERFAEASPLPSFSNDFTPSWDFALSTFEANTFWKNPVTVAALIGIDDFEIQKKQITDLLNSGYKTFKFKISPHSVLQTAKLIQTLLNLDPQVKIRLDANESFSLSQATVALELLHDFPVEYFEDPLKKKDDLQSFSKICKFPLGVDQALLNIDDLDQHLEGPYLFFILKPSLLGSEEQIKKMIQRISKAHKKFIFSSALESEIGLQELFRLASLYGEGEAQGLGTLPLFKEQYLDIGPTVTAPPTFSEEGKKWLASLQWERLKR